MKFIELTLPDKRTISLRTDKIDCLTLEEKSQPPMLIVNLSATSEPFIYKGSDAKTYYGKLKDLLNNSKSD